MKETIMDKTSVRNSLGLQQLIRLTHQLKYQYNYTANNNTYKRILWNWLDSPADSIRLKECSPRMFSLRARDTIKTNRLCFDTKYCLKSDHITDP